MVEFDIGKWLGKCINSPGHYNDLVAYVSDKDALKTHIHRKTVHKADENGRTLVKTIADEVPEYKGFFTNHFSDSIQFAIDTLSRQMIVLAATYIEAILNEFFAAVFFTYPERMYEYLNEADSLKNKGFVLLSDVISSQSKNDLIFLLATKASENANRGKIENILKRISKLCKTKMSIVLQKKLPDVMNIRNKIVHESEDYHIDEDEVTNSFNTIELLLKYLGNLCLESNIPFNDPAGIIDDRT